MTVYEKVGWVPESYMDINKIKVNFERKFSTKLLPFDYGTHDSGKSQHSTELYKFRLSEEPEINLHWSFCPKCMQIRQKYLIGYDKNNAILRDLILDGHKVVDGERVYE